MSLKRLSNVKCFAGFVQKYSHVSTTTKCEMKFAIYLPPQAETQRVPVLYWLSGLTCTEENFITKAGAQQLAGQHGLALVCPDTSPRGVQIEGAADSWDFGIGAGFYVNATEPKWSEHFNMYDYVTQELPDLVNRNFPVDPEKMGIFGHSMGGHGALICALKNPGKYKSLSAFAPVSNPINCPWGKKAFSGYLGPNVEKWKEYDATCLMERYAGPPMHILIDQGTEDQFLKDKQLLPEAFQAAVRGENKLKLRMQEGYDHGYYFISTFIADHIDWHASFLKY